MFRKIRASLLWVDIIQNYRRGDYAAAAAAADKYRTLYFNDAAFRALDATIDVLNRDSDSARVKFTALSKYLEDIDRKNSRYIKLYSDYYLCLINRQDGCEAIRLEAFSTAASTFMRRWLSLPPEEVPFD